MVNVNVFSTKLNEDAACQTHCSAVARAAHWREMQKRVLNMSNILPRVVALCIPGSVRRLKIQQRLQVFPKGLLQMHMSDLGKLRPAAQTTASAASLDLLLGPECHVRRRHGSSCGPGSGGQSRPLAARASQLQLGEAKRRRQRRNTFKHTVLFSSLRK